MPEGAHPLPDLPKNGWKGIPPAEFDGKSWTIPFASKLLGVSSDALRVIVREIGLEPSGTLNLREYRSQGRAARAYPARRLIAIAEAVDSLRDS
jgi:hypothetical protein